MGGGGGVTGGGEGGKQIEDLGLQQRRTESFGEVHGGRGQLVLRKDWPSSSNFVCERGCSEQHGL